MPVDISNIQFSYKKNSGVVPNQLVEMSFTQFPNPGSIRITAPEWLNVITENVETGTWGVIKKATYKLVVKPRVANNLAAGSYEETVEIVYPSSSGSAFPFSEKIKVSLKVVENIRLELSPGLFNFKYTIGETVPAGKYFNVTSDRSWSITADQPWVSFSNTNASGNSGVTIFVDPSGMQPGLYSGSFILDDGDSQKIGRYNLTVVGGTGNTEDYLNVNTAVLEFAETYQEPPQRETNIKVDSSLAATITSDVNWLKFSETSLAPGLSSVNIKTTGTEVLEIGSYPAEIKVSSAYGVAVINVLLQIVEVLTTGIQSNGFYFSDDRNTLVLTSGNTNAAAMLDFRVQATLELKNYKRRVPFYRNAANVIIGLETSVLLWPQELPKKLSTQAFVPVKPIRMDFTVYDTAMGSSALIERQKFQNVQFITGRTPKSENILTYLPEKISAPKDGIIAFSFISEIPPANLKVSGDATASIPVETVETNIYAVIVDLSVLELQVGQQVNISCGPVSVAVQIKPSQLSTAQLLWLNEWGCPESFNLDGIVEMIDEDESTTVVTSRSGKEYSSVIDIKEAKSWSVNTGNIYSEDESRFLGTILRSKKIWLQVGGERVEVIRTFKKLSISETRRFDNSYQLTFDAAEK